MTGCSHHLNQAHHVEIDPPPPLPPLFFPLLTEWVQIIPSVDSVHAASSSDRVLQSMQ